MGLSLKRISSVEEDGHDAWGGAVLYIWFVWRWERSCMRRRPTCGTVGVGSRGLVPEKYEEERASNCYKSGRGRGKLYNLSVRLVAWWNREWMNSLAGDLTASLVSEHERM